MDWSGWPFTNLFQFPIEYLSYSITLCFTVVGNGELTGPSTYEANLCPPPPSSSLLLQGSWSAFSLSGGTRGLCSLHASPLITIPHHFLLRKKVSELPNSMDVHEIKNHSKSFCGPEELSSVQIYLICIWVEIICNWVERMRLVFYFLFCFVLLNTPFPCRITREQGVSLAFQSTERWISGPYLTAGNCTAELHWYRARVKKPLLQHAGSDLEDTQWHRFGGIAEI